MKRLAILLCLAFLVLPTAVAAAGVLEDRLASNRSAAKKTKSEMAIVDRRQQVVVKQVSQLNRKLTELERPLAQLEQEVEALEYRIQRREVRIVELRADRVRQAKEITRLQRELDVARELLATRVVAAYKSGDTGLVEQLAAAGSLNDLFRREEALSQVVGLDERVINRISSAERKVRVKRARNFELRAQIRTDILALDTDRAQVDGQRAKAQSARDEVAAVRNERDRMRSKLQAREEALGAHLDDLEEDAKVLEDVIKNGTSRYHGQISGLSASGLIWPVSGPIVSPFGQRWGRLHAGIDIAIAAGNPIYSAAPGVVTYAGWMSGYGNMVIVQHAGSLSTGYAHQSRIATSVGQLVGQGQLLGFIGCTGHCYGDHLHFETRVNGAAQDPMQYLR
ncbi:MAG: peptidoglycan DD-metalloendopeptidase family protein [Gaiellales bacterium]